MVFGMVLLSIGKVNALTINTTTDLSSSDTNNWLEISGVNKFQFFNSSAVYIAAGNGVVPSGGGSNSGKFGVFNPQTNVSSNLSGTCDWCSYSNFRYMDVFNTSAVYFALLKNSGGFLGVYNPQTNTSQDLRGTGQQGDYPAGVDAFNSSAVYIAEDLSGLFIYNPQKNTTVQLAGGITELFSIFAYNISHIYLGGRFTNGRLAYWDNHLNALVDLGGTDGGWIGSSDINAIYALNDTSVYIGLAGGKFGVYNPQTNFTMNLSDTDTNDWMGTNNINSIFSFNNSEEIYIGLANGGFGVYNSSSNITSDLSTTDTGDWIGTSSINSISGNKTTFYLGIASGKLGVIYAPSQPSQPKIVNVSPANPIINSPANDFVTHNATLSPNINFTITAGTFNNISFSVFIDINSNPITIINSSNSTQQGNFTIIYTIPDSLNNTYFLKVNGTDNQSNFFSSQITLNLTNNISNYNVTNVTITTIPPVAGNTLTGYCNMTSFSAEKNNQSMTERLFYLNNTKVTTNINSTTLAGTNTTLNADITFSCRVNNGYGETAWTSWVNSSTATVGDTTAPTITAQAINGNSFTTNNMINITLNGTDNIAVNNCKAEINGTNYTMTALDAPVYSLNALGGTQTWNTIGLHNISAFYCADGSSNIARDQSNITFTVSSPSSGGSGSNTGGGGGGVQVIENNIIILGNLTIQLKPSILSRYYLYTPFKQKAELFKYTFQSNKILDKCISSVWNCTLAPEGSSFTISYLYSNYTTFIGNVQGDVVLLDASSLAKTISPSVTFINIGYAVPVKFNDEKSTNYVVFLLDNNDRRIGIRLWFLMGLAMLTIAIITLWSKYL